VVSTTSDFAPTLSEHPLIKPFLSTRLEVVNGTSLLERMAAYTKPRE
jgi:hypothetical protein